jgi:hypothetical protein
MYTYIYIYIPWHRLGILWHSSRRRGRGWLGGCRVRIGLGCMVRWLWWRLSLLVRRSTAAATAYTTAGDGELEGDRWCTRGAGLQVVARHRSPPGITVANTRGNGGARTERSRLWINREREREIRDIMIKPLLCTCNSISTLETNSSWIHGKPVYEAMVCTTIIEVCRILSNSLKLH